jgi:hypothetical protein
MSAVRTTAMLWSINIWFLRNSNQETSRSVSLNFCIQINLLRLADYKSEICGCQSKFVIRGAGRCLGAQPAASLQAEAA